MIGKFHGFDNKGTSRYPKQKPETPLVIPIDSNVPLYPTWVFMGILRFMKGGAYGTRKSLEGY